MKKILLCLLCLSLLITPISVYADSWSKQDGIFVNSNGEEIVGAMRKGIDVSYHQGDIDWEKVSQDDIEFAFIRVGSSKSGVDKCYHENMAGATGYNIPVGVYIYSYATTPDEAAAEAKFVLENIKDYPIAYPIAFDIEDEKQRNMTAVQLQAIILSFFGIIEDAGYYPIVYSSKNWLTEKIGPLGYDVWAAQYNTNCEFPGYCFWQATSKGQVDGISGNVDVNFQFKIYDVIINKTGIRKIQDKYFYVEDYIIQNGWIELDGEKYYASTKTNNLLIGRFKVGKYHYLADETGKLMSGFISYKRNKYYADKKSKRLVTNKTITINNNEYTADEEGVLTDGSL